MSDTRPSIAYPNVDGCECDRETRGAALCDKHATWFAPMSEDTLRLMLVDLEAYATGADRELSELRIRLDFAEGRRCLNCGKEGPCELDKAETSGNPNWPGSPCTFDIPAPELYKRWQELRIKVARVEALVEKWTLAAGGYVEVSIARQEDLAGGIGIAYGACADELTSVLHPNTQPGAESKRVRYPLTPEGISAAIQADKDAHIGAESTQWFRGPQGGLSVNICCQNGHWFNESPFGLEPLDGGGPVPKRPYVEYAGPCPACTADAKGERSQSSPASTRKEGQP